MRRVVTVAMFAAPAYLGAVGWCVDAGLYATAGGIALGLVPLVVAVSEWLSGGE